MKHGRGAVAGVDPGDVVYAEQLCEDAIRAEGHRLVQWTWGELGMFGPVANRFRAA